MIRISRATADDIWLKTPGQWRPAILTDGRLTATISCPQCGQVGSLSHHEIAKDGAVTPSVVCPYADDPDKPCSFHDHVQLAGWPP